jgi:hypothetical protein
MNFTPSSVVYPISTKAVFSDADSDVGMAVPRGAT